MSKKKFSSFGYYAKINIVEILKPIKWWLILSSIIILIGFVIGFINTFTMIMLVNLAEANVTMYELNGELKKLGEEVGVSIHLQHEGVFDAMHKV